MRVSKTIVLAIYGRSCTGKTTIAHLLSEQRSLPLRLCGDLVRRAASDLKLNVDGLADSRHRQIDSQTVDWVRKATDLCIVEGRFLDQVLAPVGPLIYLVYFEASIQARADRMQERTQRVCTESDIEKRDAADDAFRTRMYENILALPPSLTLDTTIFEPKECVDYLTLQIEPLMRERG